MADEINIVVKATDNFSGVLGNFGSIVTGVESAIRLAGDALKFFGDMALDGLNAIASYERLGLALETLSAKELLATGEFENMNDALAAAGPMAEELLDWMQQLAIKSPFTLEGVANAFRMAEAYGFTAEEAKRLTQAMIDFAAGTGASEQVMGQIALALGQIQAKGKLAGQEVLQLVNAGLPVTQILADAFGVTTAQIEKMREDGLIPADEAIRAITEYLENNFAGAAERQATSWAGLQGTFADIKQMGLREFFGGMFDVLQPLAVSLSEFLQTEGLDKLGEWGTKLGEFTKSFIEFADRITSSDIVTASENLFQKIFDTGFGSMSTDAAFAILDRAISDMFDRMTNQVILWAEGDGAKELSNKVISFIDHIGEGEEVQSKSIAAIQRLLNALVNAVEKIDWSGIAIAIDNKIASSISGIDWKSSGQAFADGLIKSISNADFSNIDTNKLQASLTMLQSPISSAIQLLFSNTATGNAISNAITQWFDGAGNAIANAWNNIDWEYIKNVITNSLYDLGRNSLDGYIKGFNDRVSWANPFNEWVERMVNQIKDYLGISSPSTLFAYIGKSIVDGLILGFTNAWGGLLTIANNSLDNFLDLFGIDLGGLLGGSSGSGLGTASGGVGGSTGTQGGGGSTAQTVNNYFYGTVYIGSSLDDANYDCPSPNPLVAASGNQLVATGY